MTLIRDRSGDDAHMDILDNQSRDEKYASHLCRCRKGISWSEFMFGLHQGLIDDETSSSTVAQRRVAERQMRRIRARDCTASDEHLFDDNATSGRNDQ